MKCRIIIQIDDDCISHDEALYIIMQVIAKGKISEDRFGKTYCWHCSFENNIHVITRDRTSAKSAYSFLIYRDLRSA